MIIALNKLFWPVDKPNQIGLQSATLEFIDNSQTIEGLIDIIPTKRDVYELIPLCERGYKNTIVLFHSLHLSLTLMATTKLFNYENSLQKTK